MDGEGRRKAGTSLGEAKSKDDEEKAGETEEEDEGRDCLRERFLGRGESGELRSKTWSPSSAGGMERRACVASSSLSEGHEPSEDDEDDDEDEGTGDETFRRFARGS